MTESRLVPVRRPKDPEGVVIVLHGGAARRDRTAVSPTQLSVIRMIPVAHRLARAGRGRLTVYRLLNSARGWDVAHTPVDDARWAMEQVDPGLPVSLVGHSLGGRAALLAGDGPTVRSVVALNPWVYPSDAADLAGRRVLIVHGDADRIASPARSLALARTLRRTTQVDYVTVPDGKHAMLRHHAEFERLAADFVVETLLD